jgi:hypothetical protein
LLPHLAIIDPQIFEIASQRRQKNKERSRRNRKYDYLLSGRFRCVCGHLLSGSYKGKMLIDRPTLAYYRCNSFAYGHLKTCREPMVRLDKADALVWDWVQSLLLDERTLDEGLHSMANKREEELEPKRNRMATLGDLIANIDCKISKLMIAFEDEQDETITETLQDRVKKLSLQKKSLIQERQSIQSEIEQRQLTSNEVQSVKSRAAQIRSRLFAELTIQQKRAILEILDVDVTLRRDESGRWLDITCGFLPDSESIEFSSS